MKTTLKIVSDFKMKCGRQFAQHLKKGIALSDLWKNQKMNSETVLWKKAQKCL